MVAKVTERLPLASQPSSVPQFGTYGNDHEQTGPRESGVLPPIQQYASSSNSPAPAGQGSKGIVIGGALTPSMNKEQKSSPNGGQNKSEKSDKRPLNGGYNAGKDKGLAYPLQSDTRGASPTRPQHVQEAPLALPPGPNTMGRDQILDLLQEQLGPGFRPVGRPMYRKPHTQEVERTQFSKGYRVPEFHTFNGESMQSSVEHVAWFQVQCGEAGTNDPLKLKLFSNSLTETAFTWEPFGYLIFRFLFLIFWLFDFLDYG